MLQKFFQKDQVSFILGHNITDGHCGFIEG